MIPVRCFTCGKVISGVYEEFKQRSNERRREHPRGEKLELGDILDDLKVKRYCCRRMLMTHVEIVDILAPYQ
jgi:DNA-directed RNA polymerase subunit N